MSKPTPSVCRTCGVPIYFFITGAGKRMPVDASSVAPGDTELDLKKHRSHFATCPYADRYRKPRKAKR
jgi:hypothetical protein